ncbi:hypothetical protein [Entomospira culicis]|uniref:CDP-Glycerol:Poly(Glycerophosphate) glycerophosphotransferase n=1 Tax=Entomospira culicis TaxID=2719989 RepID=A0A968GLS8_9SPIO|nr:hypothetical protein [Entomospira culicis]NIZ19908.1 hypothetical protein [Entomospira culicis]NIZ70135.1 hypothetical protein [Entomospira culicis]WDI38062.1 hypothetical protein PVA46_07940 [Entomospira culicis]WDI39685.1 hypothetical protein PVA47_07940 [Entomospira culicis]
MLQKLKDKIKNRLRSMLGISQLEEVLERRDQMLKNASDLLLREANTFGLPLRVLFLVYDMRVWNALDAVYRMMKDDDDFTVIVAVVADDERGVTCLEDNQRAIEALGIEYFILGNQTADLNYLKTLKLHVIVRQYPWQDAYPDIYRPYNLQFARICYIPYALSIVQFETVDYWKMEMMRASWLVFKPQWLLAENNENIYASVENPFYPVGYPKFESIVKSRASWPIESGARKFRMIWSPHNSISENWTWLQFGTFLENYQDFLAFAQAQQERVEIVLAAHPHFMERIESVTSVATQTKVRRFFAEWQALPNTAIHQESSYGGIFHASDLLITDGISWLMEYQLMQKPIIFIERADHWPFTNFGNTMIEAVHAYPTFPQAKEKILSFMHGEKDEKLALMQRNRAAIYEEGAAQKIVQAIKERYLAEVKRKRLE